MINLIINRLRIILATSPDQVLLSSHIGLGQPINSSQLPAIVLSLSIDSTKGHGIGSFVRSGNSIVQNSAIIVVEATHQTLLPNLRSLRIWPLPLKQNPSSVGKAFSTNDIQIRNVTDPANPIKYQMIDAPTQVNEFRLIVPQALIVFGKAQIEGDKLEIKHWTISRCDEIPVYRYHGTVTLEVWATSVEKAEDLGQLLQHRLASDPDLLQQNGFLALNLAKLAPIESTRYDPPVGSPFWVSKQQLVYRFSFEGEEPSKISSSLPIKHINVEMDERIQEPFAVPSNE